jgi:UDP-2,3-diacylglucosamine hydrolase
MIEVAAEESALFGSDFHLSVDDPATAEQVLSALAQYGQQSQHLFLLGDLFEVWVGDDGADALAERFAAVLRSIGQGGTQMWLMRGNRDFLLGDAFVQRCGAQLIEDPTPVMLQGRTALLAHGDALCTDDLAYQQWRATCRNPGWQQAFMTRTLAERQLMGRQARQASEAGKRERSEDIMDVNAEAVAQALEAAACAWLIHGHTHRPADHRTPIQGQILRRTVLSDWSAQDQRGALLRVSRDKVETLTGATH